MNGMTGKSMDPTLPWLSCQWKTIIRWWVYEQRNIHSVERPQIINTIISGDISGHASYTASPANVTINTITSRGTICLMDNTQRLWARIKHGIIGHGSYTSLPTTDCMTWIICVIIGHGFYNYKSNNQPIL